MVEDRVDRRLAAIFAADIAGYSRLMGADEEGTLRQLKAHRKELVDPKITEHRGRIVKTTGDGMLVEFVSVVDAVRCAVDIQRGMRERNSDIPAENLNDELRKQRRRARERKPLDGRTRLQRRIRALRDGYLAALGGTVSLELRDRCERAAQLVAIAEEARRKALAGGVDLDDLVRIENASDRAVRALGLYRPYEPTSRATGLKEYLASRQAKVSAAPLAVSASPKHGR
jgi:hypothetical protein